MDLRLRQKQLRPERETGHRPPAAFGADNMVKGQTAVADFLSTLHIADGPQSIGASAGDLVVRLPERFADAVHLIVDVVIAVCIDKAHIGTHQVLQKLVAKAFRHAALFQNKDCFQPQLSGRRRRQHGVIGLRAAGRENNLGFLLHRICQQIFQLSGLVSAEPQTAEIIAFDIDIRVQQSADPIESVNRCRENPEGYFRKVIE